MCVCVCVCAAWLWSVEYEIQVMNVRMRERMIVSFSVGCIQTMESYFYYSMEKCLHYSDNNTKLDSSQIFPASVDREEKKYRRETQRIWSNTSNTFSRLSSFPFFDSFILFMYNCTSISIVCISFSCVYSFWLAALLPAAPEIKMQSTDLSGVQNKEPEKMRPRTKIMKILKKIMATRLNLSRKASTKRKKSASSTIFNACELTTAMWTEQQQKLSNERILCVK